MNWGSNWAYWIDEAQNMKYGDAPWFTAISDGYIGRHGDNLYRRHRDGTADMLSNQTAELNTVEKYSAASTDELYAIRTATSEVVRFNASTGKFDSPIAPPANKTIVDLEAAGASRLWAVTSDGVLYAYSP